MFIEMNNDYSTLMSIDDIDTVYKMSSTPYECIKVSYKGNTNVLRLDYLTKTERNADYDRLKALLLPGKSYSSNTTNPNNVIDGGLVY